MFVINIAYKILETNALVVTEEDLLARAEKRKGHR